MAKSNLEVRVAGAQACLHAVNTVIDCQRSYVMAYTETMSSAGMFASQFVAERPNSMARSRTMQALRCFARAFGVMGLVLDGADPNSAPAR